MIGYDARCVLFFFLSMYVLKSLSTYLLCIYYLSGLDFRSWSGSVGILFLFLFYRQTRAGCSLDVVHDRRIFPELEQICLSTTPHHLPHTPLTRLGK